MKSVLISIRPEWCEKIVSGKKTIEVRKTRPKCETPFKCFIYMTAGNAVYPVTINGNPYICSNNGGKQVIGEFICDRISEAHWMQDFGYACVYKEWQDNEDCMTNDEMLAYIGDKDVLYGWHISELKIYDEPKGLWEFCRNCNPGYGADCKFCKTHGGSRSKMLQRPPQSWCYVEK